MKEYVLKPKNIIHKSAQFLSRLKPELKLPAKTHSLIREAILYGQKICPELILEEYRKTAEKSSLNTTELYHWMIVNSTQLQFEKELTFSFQREISRNKRALFASTLQNHLNGLSVFRYKNNEYSFTGIGETLYSLRAGVNESGLFVTRHRIYSNETGAGITPGMVIRLLLQRCGSADAALALLQSIPHSSCASYFVGQKNQACVIETAPGQVKIVPPDKFFLTLANHFISEELVPLDIKNAAFPENNSIRRDSHAAFFIMKNRHKLDTETAKTILSHREGDIYSTEGNFITRYAMIYEEDSGYFTLTENLKGKRKYKKIKIG